MASFNRVILAGNMTRDPELAHTASNMPICKFGLATNRKWRDKNSGENREEVCYVDCTAFGRTAEVIHQYFGKGKSILIEGRLQFSQWEAQDGSKRSKLGVVAERFEFIGSSSGEQRDGGRAPSRQTAAPAASGAPMPSDDYGPPADGDVPF